MPLDHGPIVKKDIACFFAVAATGRFYAGQVLQAVIMAINGKLFALGAWPGCFHGFIGIAPFPGSGLSFIVNLMSIYKALSHILSFLPPKGRG